jgi:hypothetical protein
MAGGGGDVSAEGGEVGGASDWSLESPLHWSLESPAPLGMPGVGTGVVDRTPHTGVEDRTDRTPHKPHTGVEDRTGVACRTGSVAAQIEAKLDFLAGLRLEREGLESATAVLRQVLSVRVSPPCVRGPLCNCQVQPACMYIYTHTHEVYTHTHTHTHTRQTGRESLRERQGGRV